MSDKMTTKGDDIFLKQLQKVLKNYDCRMGKSGRQFFNLNLNQSHHLDNNLSSVSSFSKSHNSKNNEYTIPDNFQRNKESKSLSFKRNNSKLCYLNGGEDVEKDQGYQKRWKNDKNENSNKNNSTLSLHIAAYENTFEVDSNENKSIKTKAFQSNICKLRKQTNQDLLEFPRQLEEDESTTPQIQQFKASQRLFTPNQGASSSQRSNQGASSSQRSNQGASSSQRHAPNQGASYSHTHERPKEHLNVSDDQICAYMTLLGLENLTQDNLTRRYRTVMRLHHVDKGGNLEMTQSINQAYRILKICLENNRYIPFKGSKPGPSTSASSNNYDEYKAYAEREDDWAQYSKVFKPKSRNPKYFFKPTKFDKAFQPDWKHPEDAEDPLDSELGKARSRPKKYNNGYAYDDEDEYVPNDRQNYSTKNDGEPRVIRGGLELRKPLSGIELPDNYDRLSQSDLLLNEITKVDLQTNPQLNELYTLLSSFERDPSFDTLIQRTRTFIYLDWAQSNQSDTTQYQNIAIEQSKSGAVSITLPQFEEDDIVDDRLKEGAIIQLYSAEDLTIKAKATVETVDWDLHRITISFMNKPSGERLLSCGHRCNISMAPSRFIYRAFIRGLTGIMNDRMIDYVYPDPQFEEPYEEFSNITEQRVMDRETHQQSHGSILFNHKQEVAIDAIVNRTCGNYPFLLFGPPGTGKTATLVECVHRITKLGKEKRILVCCPSNMAADVIAETILQRGIIENKYVFRLNSLSFEYKKRNKSLDPIACIVKEGSNHCFGIPSLRNLQVFRVIITTLTSSTYLSMAGGLRGYFSHILIDESAQATEQEVMIPIGNLAVPGKTTVALYGDPKQLGAVDKVPVLGDFGYNQSMMERLLKLPAYQSGDHRLFVMLEQNYRTHGLILRPASRLFYSQKLISMKTDKSLYGMCGWSELPNPSFPLIFHSIRGSKEIRSATSSYKNHYENDLCLEYVKKLQKHGVRLNDIGIISPYKFQCTMLKDYLQNYKMYGVTVNSVEGFQGSERRVIIFLTTRTHSMGFLSCDKRLNTSITRAQQLLIVLGDEELLGQHIAWNHFIHYCRYHGGFKGSTLMGAPSPDIPKPSPPPGFKAITTGHPAVPPGFERDETTGVPVNVGNNRDMNVAYNNTTDEMKGEYDVDDDHDFDLTCNVRASDYINFEGKWVDQTYEDFAPDVYPEDYEGEYQNGYSNPQVAADGGEDDRNEFFDTYENTPPPPAFEESHYRSPGRHVRTVESQQSSHPYDDASEEPIPPPPVYDDRVYQEHDNEVFRQEHQQSNQRERNYQYDYDMDSERGSPRRSQHDRSYNESGHSRQYENDAYYNNYHGYQDERHYSPQHYQNGYDSSHYRPHYDDYEQQQYDRRSSRQNRYPEEDFNNFEEPHQYHHYKSPERRVPAGTVENRQTAPAYDDRIYRNQERNGEIYRNQQGNQRERNHQYDYDMYSERDSARPSQQYQSHQHDDYYNNYHGYQDERHYSPQHYQNGYDSSHYRPHYDDYEEQQYDQRNSRQNQYHNGEEEEDRRYAYGRNDPYYSNQRDYEGPSPPYEEEADIVRNDVDEEGMNEGSSQQPDDENRVPSSSTPPPPPIPSSSSGATNERKLSAEDLDDIAALYGNDQFRFRAETSDIAFEVEDFNTLADEILQMLKSTAAE